MVTTRLAKKAVVAQLCMMKHAGPAAGSQHGPVSSIAAVSAKLRIMRENCHSTAQVMTKKSWFLASRQQAYAGIQQKNTAEVETTLLEKEEQDTKPEAAADSEPIE